MQIAVIGTGYVGLVSGACFAELGHNVVCVDKQKFKVDALKKGRIPIYEPDLEKVVLTNVKEKRLSFTTRMADAVKKADIVFLAVGTPTDPKDGSADLRYIFAAAEELAPVLSKGAVVVTKSTVPVGTAKKIRQKVFSVRGKRDVYIASNPEFLREGCAVKDFLEPDRVIIGVSSKAAEKKLKQVYRPLTSRGVTLIATSTSTAELTKYAANGFLATKIAFINEMADLCEKTGADVEVLAKGMGLDPRIGRTYLKPGPGFGGSCFPKDTLALQHIARTYDASADIVSAVIESNDARKVAMADKVIEACGGSVKGMKVAVLGLAFKANTDDMRESAALDIVPGLLKAGAELRLYDPEAMEQAKQMLKLGKSAKAKWAADAYAALAGADAAVIVTEWNLFASLSLKRLKKAMKRPLVVDLRNLFDRGVMKAEGIEYHSIGRKPV